MTSQQSLPSTADVVIVGLGGIVGASLAHFLAELGVRNIVGLEKAGAIPSDIASTAHASDFIFNTSHDKLANWTTAFSRRFYEDKGFFVKRGGMEICRTDDEARTVYNWMYHPRGYVKPEDGGAMAEYDALVNRVAMWNVAVERQIRVKGPGAEAFVDFVITRNATKIAPMAARYCILCNEKGGGLNDPVLLRLAQDEFWFSLADTDLMLWLQAINLGRRWDVDIDEIDVCPVQIQGALSEDLMVDLVGEAVREVPYYGLMDAEVCGVPVLVSQTGFTGEKGYEVYVRDASVHAETVWYGILRVGEKYGLAVVSPAHHRRIAAGILSWGQDMDVETSPFQVNLGYQVPRRKAADYIGKRELERQRAEIDAGRFPFRLKMVGLREIAQQHGRDHAD